MKYYLLSLKWTNPNDLLFTFWRAEAAGYTFIKSYFGIYSEEEARARSEKPEGLPQTVFMAEKSKVDELCVPLMNDGRPAAGLPINEYTLQELAIAPAMLLCKLDYHRWDGVEFVLNTSPNPEKFQ